MSGDEPSRLDLLKQAHKHERDKLLTASEEDYIEAIYEIEKLYGYARITDISEVLGVKPPTVLGMVRRLEKKGLVNYIKHHGVRLSEKGRRDAKKIVEAHELIREFLIAIDVDEKRANMEAELIEHFPSEDTLKRLRLVYEKCIKNCQL